MRIQSFILTLFVSLSAMAQTPAPAVYLEKVSKSLRGMPPSVAEREALAQAVARHEEAAFLSDKVKQYTLSKEFTFKLKARIDEHFRLSASSDPFKIGITYQVKPDSAYDFLVLEIITKNQSWDRLLTAKNYTYLEDRAPTFTMNIDENINDFFFFKGILDSKVQYNLVDDTNYAFNRKEMSPVTISFDENDPRIAGVLTTSRFMARYGNTALNKNRRRAAAVFRSFLCDDMVAAIPAKTTDSEKTDYDVLLPESKTEDQLRRELRRNDPHGSLEGCMACHYKLDPMGKVFALNPSGLAPEASPGVLVYKAGSSNVNIPVSGVGDLAKNITQQKEYVNCQVNLFWKWFIGQDSPKTTVRQAELVAEFACAYAAEA